MNKVTYVINKGLKFYAEDNYEKGEVEMGSTINLDPNIATGSIERAIECAMEYANCSDKSNIELNSCDEIGRIDISVMENGEALTPSELEMANFKKGKMNLYSCIYTFYLEKHLIEDVDLSDIKL